jgi:hypothetical protein
MPILPDQHFVRTVALNYPRLPQNHLRRLRRLPNPTHRHQHLLNNLPLHLNNLPPHHHNPRNPHHSLLHRQPRLRQLVL